MNEEWIRSLLDEREAESQTLDFKRVTPQKDDEAIKKMLTDVAAFANARGGRIVYGISEDGDGRASHLVPIDGKLEEKALWIQTKILAKIFPRPHGVSVQPVHSEEGSVIVVDVPSQDGGPYQALHNEWQRFPIRAGARNVEMTYQQMYDAFALRASVEERTDVWLEKRRSDLLAAKKQGSGEQVAVVHIVPRSTFQASLRPDIGSLRDRIIRVNQSAMQSRFNYLGLVSSFTPYGAHGKPPYFQFFKNGVVEIAWEVGSRSNEDKTVRSAESLVKLFDLVPQAARAMAAVGVAGPGHVAMSYINVFGRSLYYMLGSGESGTTEPLDEALLNFGPVPYDSLDLSIEELGPLVTDLMTELFRSYGMDGCPYLDGEGRVKRRELAQDIEIYRSSWDERAAH